MKDDYITLEKAAEKQKEFKSDLKGRHKSENHKSTTKNF